MPLSFESKGQTELEAERIAKITGAQNLRS